MPGLDPTQLSQDKDFLSASPTDQIKYLSSQDADFAKASPSDQAAYLSHLTGKQVSLPATTSAGANYDAYLDSGKPTKLSRAPMKDAQKDTLADVTRGATLGAAEGAGINLSTNPRDVIEGTFKNLGQGVKDLLAQVWEANASSVEKNVPLAKYDPTEVMAHGARAGLDVIPTFIDQTATALEQGGKDFNKAIQNKDWEQAAQIAAKNATMIAMLKKAKDKATPATTAAETVKPTVGDKVQAFMRRPTEASYDVKNAVKKAISDQSEAIAKHAEQSKQVANRAELAKSVDQESTNLGKDINDLESKVYHQANANFDNVRAKIGNVQAPPDHLISTVKNAEANILQGIPENVKEFRSILKLENTSAEMSKIRNDVMAGQGMQGMKYEDLSPERRAVVDDIVDRLGFQGSASIPLTWDKLQSLKSRLDARLRDGRGLNGDLKRALFSVRDGVVDEMGQMATANGAGADWMQARDFWKQYKEDFHEATGPQGSASPVAQARLAVDPDKIRKPFERTQSAIGNRGIDILNKYPQFGGNQIAARVQSILDKNQQAKLLPERVTATVPEKPTVDIDQISRNSVEKTAQRIGRLNVWDARIVASSAIAGVVALFMGHEGTALATVAGPTYVALKDYISRSMDKPKVIDWLARTPPAELDALNKLPGIEKINIAHGLTETAIELSKRRKGFDLSPELKQFLGPANVARIAAVNSAVQTTKRKPGEQLKDLQAIQQRSSNPNLPTGEEQ